MMDLATAVSRAAERPRWEEYLEALEQERRKIEVFQRELPLSLHLVSQAIEIYRRQMAGEMLSVGCAVPSELEQEAEEMSSEEAPALEEFIPIKRSFLSEADDEDELGNRRLSAHQNSSNGGHNDQDSGGTSRQKQLETTSENVPHWLRSVQLMNQRQDPESLTGVEEHDDTNAQGLSVAGEPKKLTGAFQPFRPQKDSSSHPLPPAPSVEAAAVPAAIPAASTTSLNSGTRDGDVASGGDGGGKSVCSGGNEKNGHPHRKARRCWSPELHQRFVNALKQLGGSDVATPKRIRQLMKVDGLTNDEVKSHLQKFRLHSRRPSSMSHGNAGIAPPQQLIFVGGIWVPPPEYAAAAAVAAAAAAAAAAITEGNPPGHPTGIYAPVATVPSPKQQQQQKKQGKQQTQRSTRGREKQSAADEGFVPSDSPATSSSSRTDVTPSAGRSR